MLSDVTIRNARPDASKTIKLSDGGGLQLWIVPTGSKLWQVAYRYEGKQKKLSLGAYPAVGLKVARERRDEAKRHLAAGVDPGQHRRAEANRKVSLEANTLMRGRAMLDELAGQLQRLGAHVADIADALGVTAVRIRGAWS